MIQKQEGDTNHSGDMYPLVAYETSIPHGVLCGLIVHYLETPAELLAGEHSSVALVMRPEMARQLAAALMKAAQGAERKNVFQELSLIVPCWRQRRRARSRLRFEPA